MTGIHELIDRQRQLDAPPAEPEPPAATTPVNEGLEFLIAEARRTRDANWVDLEVILGGEIVPVTFGETSGDTWMHLCGSNPPKRDSDRPYGYDCAAVARAFPAERIKLQGKPTDAGTWASVWDLLAEEDCANVQAVLWGIHIGDHLEARKRLMAQRDASDEAAAD
ncbi:hypothetical protein AB0O16_07295 [Microbacterium sp. NPDC089180]|uniref:hypothetical protein n=1 Tax=unclassified Microbacterium TaxID=2609290 RepID=UPI00343101F6